MQKHVVTEGTSHTLLVISHSRSEAVYQPCMAASRLDWGIGTRTGALFGRTTLRAELPFPLLFSWDFARDPTPELPRSSKIKSQGAPSVEQGNEPVWVR
jgi:hypothetical protein